MSKYFLMIWWRRCRNFPKLALGGVNRINQNINKFKNYKPIQDDYVNDIQWLLSSEVPIKVRNYATELQNSLPSKIAMKAKRTKENINSPVNNNGIIMYNNFWLMERLDGFLYWTKRM
ncbi:hypothetical protein BDF21DRAFT_464156 [Thamnidium elegans]|nr:hypothetical protein BDF21DRAFT_464156 [Thamnidium elegans]